MATPVVDFPCSLNLAVPFPTQRLASTALRALQVDQELSPLVKRAFILLPSHETTGEIAEALTPEATVLQVEYRATTNRMLRVAVNGFMESLGLVLEVMKDLDVDVFPEDTPR